MSAPYLVVWTTRRSDSVRDVYRDYYRHFESSDEALKLYRELLTKDTLHAAHIVRPIHSTDYETVEAA